ncbi:MAG: hypothetical protein JKY56_07370 [Kofleriaceae bacterium]|nr:hypothetical protein [Kofleriaceae bacterium]
MSHLSRTCALLLGYSLISGCGLGPFAEEGGGSDNLPIHGGGPFTPLPVDFDTPADEPYVVVTATKSLLDPSVEQQDDNTFLIHYTRLDEEGSTIWKVDLPSIHEVSGTPELVLSADQDWEQGQVRSVSLLREGEKVTLYYEGGDLDPAIGRAVSIDGGQTYVKDVNNPIVEGLDPNITKAEGRHILVYADMANQRIMLRESPDELSFGPARVILAARSSEQGTIDQAGVAAPALRISRTLDGQELFGLYYEAWSLDNDGEVFETVGYQASFGGEKWERFLDGNEIVDSGLFGSGGPSPILGPVSGLLFYHQKRQGRGRIAAAESP